MEEILLDGDLSPSLSRAGGGDRFDSKNIVKEQASPFLFAENCA